MAAYEIYFKESVEKDFRDIPGKDLKRILQRIESLAIEPRPSGCEKLTGQERYRLRQDRYRIVYSIQPVSDNLRGVTPFLYVIRLTTTISTVDTTRAAKIGSMPKGLLNA
jgi:mRNA interferase RelE/StbE